MKAKAKHDVKVLMVDNRFSNFIAGNEYQCMLKGNGIILMDENKTGFKCDTMTDFENDFELIPE